MHENLVIVESPAKAKTIEKFLGKEFTVASCMGHIRDLDKKDFGVDVEKSYKPKYVITPDKRKVVADLKKLANNSSIVWLASDEDREGEAIAWHLKEVLKLDSDKTRRIVFHEITPDAIKRAIKNPRMIDENLVNAQQARRVLDRIVGFQVSPVLWKKVKPSLSAGRVQSVAVRLIVDREREIINFKTDTWYRVNAIFNTIDEHGHEAHLKAELNRRFDTKEEAAAFLEKCKDADFKVADVVKKPLIRTPAQPFTTSTLQQEASRKLGFSVSQTMSVAQRLYESGKITYMRTDSVNLSDLAINSARTKIIEMHGERYSKSRRYKTKSKGAQEAHEAIRPTYMNISAIEGTAQEVRLYELIWKRTMASQMADAVLEKTTVTISLSNATELFTASGEVVVFDGFLKVYFESTDDENNNSNDQDIIPPIRVNDQPDMESVTATQRFSQRPPRYTEAALVKKMEDLGIGRPSTYAPTITTIQNRNYVVREDRAGTERKYVIIKLENSKISEKIKSEITGTEKSKLFPTDMGMVVNDFLMDNFSQIMDFNFTANVEKEFDDIAEGTVVWNEMIDKFYQPFNKQVEFVLENSERSTGERILGIDPKSGKQVMVKIGRFGPVAQLGVADLENEGEKPKFAGLQTGQHLETITLEEALELFKLPRELGDFEDKTVTIGIGRFGPYVRHDNKFVSLGKDDDPYSVELERAIELIQAKRKKDEQALINTFDEEPNLKVLMGRWGPYISFNKKNYKIPKGVKAEELTLEECREIIEKAPPPKTGKGRTKK